MNLSKYRMVVDTYAPMLGRRFRCLRDVTHRRSIQTKYGFTLAGDPVMAKEGYETDEIKAFLELTKTHDAVLDIGANVGLYTCLAGSCGKHTIAIEPAPRNLKYLYRNIRENKFICVQVYPFGLAAQRGLGHIYGYGGTSSFVPGWAQARKSHSTLVEMATLDIITSGGFQHQKLLIKIDVEGYELDLLAGAAATLEMNPKPTWLVEIQLSGELIPGGVNRRFADVFQVFWKRGYHCQRIDAARTSVEPEDVSRWIANGVVDADSHDFLFTAD